MDQVRAKKRRVVVAYAKYKEKCPATGKLIYFNKSRRFPIKSIPENKENAIQAYINRTIRNPKSIYSRADLFCYIEDDKQKHLETYRGGHIYDPNHKSKFVLKHLDQGREVKKYSTAGDELNLDKAPWQLVNRYRPQRKKGNVRVYDKVTGKIAVDKKGKKMEWQDGKRRP